ncbi:hypothetical protein ACN28I_00090 [Archangium gephyra]|uniref:hypothetical protein n=1 Tax=Archangium gephyra TaxID=48 RepID=UPI003B7D32F5
MRYLALDARACRRISGDREVILAKEPRVGAGVVLLRNPNALPRAYLATPVCVPDEPAARALVLSRSFRPGQRAVSSARPARLATSHLPPRESPARCASSTTRRGP